jgi:hypothetical protein
MGQHKWMIRKSYENFEKLYKLLTRTYQDERTIPPLVIRSKSVFKKKKADMKTVTQKKESCQKFLDSCM